MTSPLIDEAVFQRAFELTLGHEGGFNDDPTDPGGATKYGVSLRYLRTQHVIDGDQDHDGDIDAQDVNLLDLKEAFQIYYIDFWLKNNYDRIIDTYVACKIFDLCVNMGAPVANKLLQRAVNTAAGKEVCIVDGICGLKTARAVNDQNPKIILDGLRKNAAAYYQMITDKNPKFQKYIKGWLARAAK